jgi:hypothetical protein
MSISAKNDAGAFASWLNGQNSRIFSIEPHLNPL